jgi:sigma-54 dependent transcriptional regulator
VPVQAADRVDCLMQIPLCDEHVQDLHQFIEETVFSEVFRYCHHSQSEAARVLVQASRFAPDTSTRRPVRTS